MKIIDHKSLISDLDRSYGVQKIFSLHEKKEYKMETLFFAVFIFDRYLQRLGAQNY